MSWRTVVISKRCKLDLSLGFMVIRDGEQTNKVIIDEMAVLVLENTAISITGCLLEQLALKKVKVIFCDSKRNPLSELTNFYGCYDNSQKIKNQISWDDSIKKLVWTYIVTNKIQQQAIFLKQLNLTNQANILFDYVNQIEYNDITNREGHSAKVYFNALFGMDFNRSDQTNYINGALNYGYSLILSAFNREVTANGYLTQLGLFHDNMFNNFNLSCDLMEPFRILVDRYIKSANYSQFEIDEKHDLINVLNQTIIINNCKQTTLNAIKIYAKSVFDALNNKIFDNIYFPNYEL